MGPCLILAIFAMNGVLKQVAPCAGELTKSLVVWSGQYPSATPGEGKRVNEVIGTEERWVKFWKDRRGEELIPRIDFDKTVVVVATQPGLAVDSIHLGPCGKHRHGVWIGAWEGKIEGTGYVAGVFPRSGIKKIEGQVLPR